MADDLGFQPTQPNNDLGFQAAPKVPNLSGVQKMAQDNLAANDNKEVPEGGEAKPPQNPMQRLETGTGLPVQKILSGSAQSSDINEANRNHYINAVKDGSASSGSDWMQSYFFGVGNAVQQGGERALGTLAYPILSQATREKLIEKGVFGQLPELTGNTGHDVTAEALTRANAILSPGIGAAYTTVAAPLAPLINPLIEGAPKLAQKVGVSPENASLIPAGSEFAMNLFGLGGARAMTHYSAPIREAVANKLDIDPAAVTPEHVDQVIAQGSKSLYPDGKDFENVSAISGFKADDLQNIYVKTGVHPDQVYADAQRDPAIMSAVNEGKIPSAYDYLIDKRPAIPEDVQKAMDNFKPIEKEEPIPTNKEYAQDLYNRLHEKLGQDTATDIESMRRELETKNELGKEVDEKLYLKKEDENVKITESEQNLYEQYVKPLAAQERALYERARALGAEEAEPVSESYVHRIAKGKGHYLDKYDTEFGSDENVGFGKPQRGISQTTSSLKEAQFHVLEDAEGKREFKAEEIPKGYKAGDKFTDKNGKEWTIKRAKTSEIEQNTDVKYYKSAIGNTEDNIRRLEKTIRNIEFLNDLKEDMHKTGFGIPPGIEDHPRDFQQVNIPQLRGWSFDPRIAEVLNDIYDKGGNELLDRINNILIKGMFLNPTAHIENVGWDYVASRGWKNVQGIKGVNYISQGIKDVREFSPEYLDVLKRGGALKLPAIWKQDFFNQMEKQFIGEMQSSKEGLDLAKSWGFDSVSHFAESVFNQSQKALWGSGDAFLMAKIRELKDSGMSTDEAIKEAQKHIVDYRVPPRVGESIIGPQLSRMLSKQLQNNPILVFTRYHFGLFKSLGHMVKDLGEGVKDMDAARIKEASGQLFATYFLLSVVNPAISSMWSSITGQNEKFRNPGITGLAGAISDWAIGKKSLGQALKSQFIVSPAVQVGADILNDKIVNPKLGHEGVQLMDYLMKQPTMSIPSIPYNIREGKQSVGEEALRQIGVTPDKEHKPKKASRKQINKLEEEEESLLGRK